MAPNIYADLYDNELNEVANVLDRIIETGHGHGHEHGPDKRINQGLKRAEMRGQ